MLAESRMRNWVRYLEPIALAKTPLDIVLRSGILRIGENLSTRQIFYQLTIEEKSSNICYPCCLLHRMWDEDDGIAL